MLELVFVAVRDGVSDSDGGTLDVLLGDAPCEMGILGELEIDIVGDGVSEAVSVPEGVGDPVIVVDGVIVGVTVDEGVLLEVIVLVLDPDDVAVPERDGVTPREMEAVGVGEKEGDSETVPVADAV